MSKPICQVVKTRAQADADGRISLDVHLHGAAEFRFVLTPEVAQALISELMLTLLCAKMKGERDAH